MDESPTYLDSSHELPSYSEGCNIKPVDAETVFSPLLKVHVSNSKRTYGLGEFIYGHIILVPKKIIKISSIFVVLEGDEVSTKSSWSANVITSRHMNLGHHITPSSAMPPDMKALPGFVYTFLFSLQIPEAKSSSMQDKTIPEHLRLPPSLGSPPQFPIAENDTPGNVARICYRLKASITTVQKDGLPSNVVNAYNYIHLTPSYSLSPSARQRTQKDSYLVRQGIKKGLLKKTSTGIMELRMRNISELTMIPSGPTTVPLTVSYCATSEASSQLLPQITLVSTKLIARTRYSSQGVFKTSPPSDTHPGIISVSQKIVLNRMSPQNSNWELNSTTNAYSTVFHLPLTLPIDKRIVPTFESCFISRDYNLEVRLYLASSSSITLTLPVNVVVSVLPDSDFPFGNVTASNIIPPLLPPPHFDVACHDTSSLSSETMPYPYPQAC